jgi:hypothetical protein
MKHATLYASGCVLCLATACSSSSERTPAPFIAGGASSGGTAGARTSSQAGTAGTSEELGGAGQSSAEGGAAGEAGASDAGAAGVAGAAPLPPGTVVTVTPGACSESADWTAATPVTNVTTSDDEELLSITADELDIVFTRSAALFRAHRDVASGSFDSGSAVTLPDGYDASGGAALSPDGKTLVLVATSGQAFASVARSARNADFGTTADPTAFTGLNQRAAQTMEHYAHPVLSPDGKSFVFAAFTPAVAGGVAVVYESTSSNGAWAMPSNISAGLFNGTTEQRALPSGLSSDSRTLFYYDEASTHQMARFRDRPDAPLYDVVDLGGRVDAVPNVSCNRIYYSAAGNILTEGD